jgi:hypothetical protein
VALVYDEGHSVDAGVAVVSLPENPSVFSFSTGSATFEEIAAALATDDRCYRQNVVMAGGFLNGPGSRTPTMQAITDAFGRQRNSRPNPS